MSDADEFQPARIPPGQKLLAPLSSRHLSTEIGLNWWASLSLHRDGWLSFDPAMAGHPPQPSHRPTRPREAKLKDLLNLCPICHYLAHCWVRKKIQLQAPRTLSHQTEGPILGRRSTDKSLECFFLQRKGCLAAQPF